MIPHTKSCNERGFTLVELSIVLVILGLLIGGVLTGQSLIRAAELRSITTEQGRFFTAVQTFRDKYFALPGDMPNAYAYWGPGCGTNDATPSTGCNGDGDGDVRYGIKGENILAWKHLGLAGLVEGSYTGTHVAGVLTIANTAPSKFANGRWDFTGSGYYVPGTPPLTGWLNLTMGQPKGDTVMSPSDSLTRAEALMIDKKMDDGMSNSGKVRGYMNTAAMVCNDTGTDAYSLTSGADVKGQCRMSFAF